MAEITTQVTPEVIAAFRDFYDEFADVAEWTDKQLLRALSLAKGELEASRWGIYAPYSFLQRGWFALAAHYLTWMKLQEEATTADGSASTPFAEASKSVRDTSTSYAIPAAYNNLSVWDAALALTPYGLEYLKLRDRAGMGAVCV